MSYDYYIYGRIIIKGFFLIVHRPSHIPKWCVSPEIQYIPILVFGMHQARAVTEKWRHIYATRGWRHRIFLPRRPCLTKRARRTAPYSHFDPHTPQLVDLWKQTNRVNREHTKSNAAATTIDRSIVYVRGMRRRAQTHLVVVVGVLWRKSAAVCVCVWVCGICWWVCVDSRLECGCWCTWTQ